MCYRLVLSLCLSAALSTAVAGQDLPKTNVKVIGLNSPTPVSIYDEVPFWRKTIPEASKGAITADITPLDQMSIDDKTMLRLLKLGVMDFAGMDISKMAGDDPRFEGCDLAGLTLDPDSARKACDSYRTVIDRQMQKNWNAKFLAFGGNTPQVFWCKDVVGGLAGAEACLYLAVAIFGVQALVILLSPAVALSRQPDMVGDDAVAQSC